MNNIINLKMKEDQLLLTHIDDIVQCLDKEKTYYNGQVKLPITYLCIVRCYSGQKVLLRRERYSKDTDSAWIFPLSDKDTISNKNLLCCKNGTLHLSSYPCGVMLFKRDIVELLKNKSIRQRWYNHIEVTQLYTVEEFYKITKSII